jgi:hypothetical protein
MEAMMIRPNKLAIVFCVFFALGVALDQGCAHTPPNLSPVAVTAFQNLQIAKALDTVRDIAVDANATTPPVLSTSTTRAIVSWHQGALQVLNARAAGWPATIAASLDAVVSNLPQAERATLAPYVALAKTVLNQVSHS